MKKLRIRVTDAPHDLVRVQAEGGNGDEPQISYLRRGPLPAPQAVRLTPDGTPSFEVDGVKVFVRAHADRTTIIVVKDIPRRKALRRPA